MTESEAIKELHEIRPRGGIIPQKRAEALDVAIKALEMQKKLAEFSGMDICNRVEDCNFEENNISEYKYEASVDNFLIDKEE